MMQADRGRSAAAGSELGHAVDAPRARLDGSDARVSGTKWSPVRSEDLYYSCTKGLWEMLLS